MFSQSSAPRQSRGLRAGKRKQKPAVTWGQGSTAGDTGREELRGLGACSESHKAEKATATTTNKKTSTGKRNQRGSAAGQLHQGAGPGGRARPDPSPAPRSQTLPCHRAPCASHTEKGQMRSRAR